MSSSFGKVTMMDQAKSTATTILNFLNPDDQVSVLAFSSGVTFAPSDPCYRNQLSEPNPTTLENFKSFVSNLYPQANANYTQAFASAFKLFNTSDVSNSDLAIILITNGENLHATLNSTMDAISKGNQPYGNKVTIYVYCLSADTNVYNQLNVLTQQSFVVNSVGEPQATTPIILSESKSLRSQLSNYFASSTFPSTVPVEFDKPFYDSIDGDLSISLCLPVQKNGRLNGSVCVDATINELFSEVQNFQQSTAAYAFLMDGLGRLLIHPLLPVSLSATSYSSPVSLDLVEYDLGGNIYQLQQNMLTQMSGSMKISSRRVYQRGQSELSGVDANYLPSTYYWRKVTDTNLSVCLVVSDGYLNISIAGNSFGNNYHRVMFLDQVLFDQYWSDLCNLAGKAVQFRDKTAVKLAPACFQDPQLYVDQPVSAALYESWADFLEGRVSTSISPSIKSNIRDAVESTYVLESFWTNNPSDIILGRYIGLREGIFRRFPGELFPKEYDPTTRPWYRQAVANPNIFSIYGPFQHASINICIASIAKTITKHIPQLNAGTAAIGVMSVSLTMSYFNRLIRETVKACSQDNERCFLVDQSGYVVMHPIFAGQTGDCANITGRHMTGLEGAIAQDMITNRILVPAKCASYVNKNNIKYWMISLPTGVKTGLYYDIYAVGGTNIYVVQVHLLYRLPSVTCNCLAESMADSFKGTCSSSSQTNTNVTLCECPCFTKTQYSQLCLGQLQYDVGESPCIPPPPVWTSPPVNTTAYLAQLCPCDSNCTIADVQTTSVPVQTSPGGSIFLSLLALLVLLVVPVVVIVICWIKKRNKHIWTDSSAYSKSSSYVQDYPLGSQEHSYRTPQVDGISEHDYDTLPEKPYAAPENSPPLFGERLSEGNGVDGIQPLGISANVPVYLTVPNEATFGCVVVPGRPIDGASELPMSSSAADIPFSLAYENRQSRRDIGRVDGIDGRRLSSLTPPLPPEAMAEYSDEPDMSQHQVRVGAGRHDRTNSSFMERRLVTEV